MRPLISLWNVVGLLMLGYAVGVIATPTSGVMNWLDMNTLLTPPMVAAAFAGCGVYILIARPAPPLFSLLITPLMLYGAAATLYFVTTPGVAATIVIAHFGLWLTVNAALYEQARRGPSLPTSGGD